MTKQTTEQLVPKQESSRDGLANQAIALRNSLVPLMNVEPVVSYSQDGRAVPKDGPGINIDFVDGMLASGNWVDGLFPHTEFKDEYFIASMFGPGTVLQPVSKSADLEIYRREGLGEFHTAMARATLVEYTREGETHRKLSMTVRAERRDWTSTADTYLVYDAVVGTDSVSSQEV